MEYRIENVMLHPLAFAFVQRTGRVVNILEFKHSRVAAGTLYIYFYSGRIYLGAGRVCL